MDRAGDDCWNRGLAVSLLERGVNESVESVPVLAQLPAAPPPTGTRAPAFEEVVDRYQTAVYRYAVQLIGNQTDADDFYQETLVRAYQAFGRLDGTANHRAQLYRIATDTFLSDWRTQGRVDFLDGGILRDVASFVAELPPRQRVALTLRKYHELGYDEIAAVLRCSEAAARVSVHEALRTLSTRAGNRLLGNDAIVGPT